MATALVSALSGRMVDPSVAMTGEISLRGRVMPIGGLREKTMAAYKSGIRTIVIPYRNLHDLREVDPVVKAAIDFVPVKELNEVFDTALIKNEKRADAAAAAVNVKNNSAYTTIRAERK